MQEMDNGLRLAKLFGVNDENITECLVAFWLQVTYSKIISKSEKLRFGKLKKT